MNPESKIQKKADLLTLKKYEESGLISLKYLDEAGFGQLAAVSYTYSKIGSQKLIGQPKHRGKRISIIGILEIDKSFNYGLVMRGVKSKAFIKILDWLAQKAEIEWQETGKITVIVMDNYSLHKSRIVKAEIPKWESKKLNFFYLPSYSPELNLIEPEWSQIKTHELAGRMFNWEYDLIKAIIDGIENRSQHRGYICERFRFNQE